MTLLFSDISNWQRGIDLAAHRQENSVIALKASQGDSWDDDSFAEFRAEVHRLQFEVVLIYHFAGRSETVLGTPQAEARNFARAVGELRDNEIPILDLEYHGTLSPTALATWALDWALEEGRLSGVWPGLYTGQSFLWDRLGADRRLMDFVLWVANYGKASDPMDIVSPHTPWMWELHQFSSQARRKGFRGDIDLNRFEGTPAELLALRGRTGRPDDEVAYILLRRGDTGARVIELQNGLNVHGYGLIVDGDFGARTENAVRDFQERAGLAVDGVVGPKTWTRIFEGPLPKRPNRTVTYGWQEIHSFVKWNLGSRAADPLVGQSYGGRHSANSWHYRDSKHPSRPQALGGIDGCAIDYGHLNSDVDAIKDLVLPYAAMLPEIILDHDMWRYGRYYRYIKNDHSGSNRHIHIAIKPDAQFPIQIGVQRLTRQEVIDFWFEGDESKLNAWAALKWRFLVKLANEMRSDLPDDDLEAGLIHNTLRLEFGLPWDPSWD